MGWVVPGRRLLPGHTVGVQLARTPRRGGACGAEQRAREVRGEAGGLLPAGQRAELYHAVLV